MRWISAGPNLCAWPVANQNWRHVSAAVYHKPNRYCSTGHIAMLKTFENFEIDFPIQHTKYTDPDLGASGFESNLHAIVLGRNAELVSKRHTLIIRKVVQVQKSKMKLLASISFFFGHEAICFAPRRQNDYLYPSMGSNKTCKSSPLCVEQVAWTPLVLCEAEVLVEQHFSLKTGTTFLLIETIKHSLLK